MAATAILKIGLMAISRPLWHIFARNFIQGLKTIHHKQFCRQNLIPSYFTSEKIQNGGGRHFKNWFKGYISDNMAYICMKCCKRTKNGVPESILLKKKFTFREIQDGGGRHFEIKLVQRYCSDVSKTGLT